MWATWATLPKMKKKIIKCWKMMILTVLKVKKFLKNFDPQVKIFKKSPRLVEISASLKIFRTMKLSIKKLFGLSTRLFWPILAYAGFWEWNFVRNFGPKKALRGRNFCQFGGFLGVRQKFLTHFWKYLYLVPIHPKNCFPTPNTEKVIQSKKKPEQNCNVKRFGSPCVPFSFCKP